MDNFDNWALIYDLWLLPIDAMENNKCQFMLFTVFFF